MAISVCDVRPDVRAKETVPHGNAAFPLACYEDDMTVMSFPPHWHDEYEYIAATAGRVTVTLGAEEAVLEAGDGVFINGSCLHAVRRRTGGESALRSLVFAPRFISGNPESCFWQKITAPLARRNAPNYLLLPDSDEACRSILTDMMLAWDAVTQEVPDYENEARYRITRAFGTLIRRFPPETAGPQRDDPAVARMKKMLAYLDAHYAEDIGNTDLMALCGISESVLLRTFKQIAGTSPMQYLLRLRLEKAADLLRGTDARSGDIALACGFRDFSYFTKVFKRGTGMTPVAYREKFR